MDWKQFRLFLGLFLGWIVSSNEAGATEKCVTVVNPVRGRELWKDQSLKPIEEQYKIINDLDLKATWLVQNEATKDKALVEKIKQFNEKQELGIWLEVSSKLALKARVYYPINRPWYSPEAVFLSGYNRQDRKKLIDRMMIDFKDVFGYWPKSVGAWWIDSYSLNYLEKKYGIRTAMIVADQKTTDSYGVWGQWWGYPYYPAKNNILAPGNSKVLIIQWALRDPELAYFGDGPKTSNHSLQANDYRSLGLEINYFKKLAGIYFDNRNKLGQITVGLETGMESVDFVDEYKKQLEWIKQNQVTDLTMNEMEIKYRETYGKNPEEISIGEWKLTPNFMENIKLGERIEYQKGMVFKDYEKKDTDKFLNRIYTKENLIKVRWFPWRILIIILMISAGVYFGINWWLVGIGEVGLKLAEHLRYSMVDGEKMAGILVDNFRFIGVTDKFRLINQDLTNLIASSMLKLEIKEWEYLVWFLICLLIGIGNGKYTEANKNK